MLTVVDVGDAPPVKDAVTAKETALPRGELGASFRVNGKLLVAPAAIVPYDWVAGLIVASGSVLTTAMLTAVALPSPLLVAGTASRAVSPGSRKASPSPTVTVTVGGPASTW